MGWVITPRPGRFTPGKDTWYPLYRSLGGSQGRSGRVWKMHLPGVPFEHLQGHQLQWPTAMAVYTLPGHSRISRVPDSLLKLQTGKQTLSYTSAPPYAFLACTRNSLHSHLLWNTQTARHELEAPSLLPSNTVNRNASEPHASIHDGRTPWWQQLAAPLTSFHTMPWWASMVVQKYITYLSCGSGTE